MILKRLFLKFQLNKFKKNPQATKQQQQKTKWEKPL